MTLVHALHLLPSDALKTLIWAEILEHACFPDPWKRETLESLATPPLGQLYFWFDHSGETGDVSLFPIKELYFAAGNEKGSTGSERSRQLDLPSHCVGYALCWIVLGEVQLHRFAIHPKHQGRGEGTAFLQALIAQWIREECQSVTLEVREQNYPARALYERCGFARVGTRPGYYSDTGEAALLYTWGAVEAMSVL